jgi:predicted nucleic acid-binding protein
MRAILLDTSAFSAHRRGHPEVSAAIAEARTVALNTVVLGELLDGFRRGSRYERNLADLDAFRSSPRFEMLSLGEETAGAYAQILGDLRRAGTPVPTNDIWIAASALQHGRLLLTLDRHFLHLPLIAVQCFS